MALPRLLRNAVILRKFFMKIVSNTLDIVWETWEDPGESGAGSRESETYPVIKGQVIFEAENEEEMEKLVNDGISDEMVTYDDFKEFMEMATYRNIHKINWREKMNGNRCTVFAESCVADRAYESDCSDDEDDYSDEYDSDH